MKSHNFTFPETRPSKRTHKIKKEDRWFIIIRLNGLSYNNSHKKCNLIKIEPRHKKFWNVYDEDMHRRLKNVHLWNHESVNWLGLRAARHTIMVIIFDSLFASLFGKKRKWEALGKDSSLPGVCQIIWDYIPFRNTALFYL